MIDTATKKEKHTATTTTMMATGPGQAPDNNTRVNNHAAVGSLLTATQAQLRVVDDDRPNSMCDAESIGLHDCSWREIFKSKVEGAPTLGLDFLRASKDTTTVKYKLEAPREGPWNGEEEAHATLTLQQDLGKLGLGAVVWDCGEDLAEFLGRHRHLVTGKRVLDLGTGTGIAGLAAAQCGARKVTLTDHAALGPLVQSNVERNQGCSGSHVTFTPFSWGNSTEAEARKLASLDDPFDLVLASDCLYDPAMFPAFRRALVAFCGPRTVLLMTYKRRLDSREQDFFAQLELDFDLEVCDPSSRQPLDTRLDTLPRLDTHTLQKEEPGVNSATSRGVYLLLGARGGHRSGNKGGLSSPLNEWRGIPSVVCSAVGVSL